MRVRFSSRPPCLISCSAAGTAHSIASPRDLTSATIVSGKGLFCATAQKTRPHSWSILRASIVTFCKSMRPGRTVVSWLLNGSTPAFGVGSSTSRPIACESILSLKQISSVTISTSIAGFLKCLISICTPLFPPSPY